MFYLCVCIVSILFTCVRTALATTTATRTSKSNGFDKRSIKFRTCRTLFVASSPFLSPSLARSREARFACPNRRACLQAILFPILHSSIPALGTLWMVFFGSWHQPRQLLSFAHVETKKTHSERVKPSYTADSDILTFFILKLWGEGRGGIWQTMVFVRMLTSGPDVLSSRKKNSKKTCMGGGGGVSWGSTWSTKVDCSLAYFARLHWPRASIDLHGMKKPRLFAKSLAFTSIDI